MDMNSDYGDGANPVILKSEFILSLCEQLIGGAGQGLLKVGSSLVPFVNKFPRNTELYKLMTTKFGEV